MWYKSKVFKGDQTGRTIHFPTVNLDPHVIPQEVKQGVYASTVKYNGQMYKGALYFGPRLVLNETRNVLEIFIIDFNKEIYDEEIEFQIKDFVRGVIHFSSMNEMKEQLANDVTIIKNYSL